MPNINSINNCSQIPLAHIFEEYHRNTHHTREELDMISRKVIQKPMSSSKPKPPVKKGTKKGC